MKSDFQKQIVFFEWHLIIFLLYLHSPVFAKDDSSIPTQVLNQHTPNQSNKAESLCVVWYLQQNKNKYNQSSLF